MKTVDLQIRMARKMASGRGAMQITQTDLDVLVESGAYAALCNAATEELKQRQSSETRYTHSRSAKDTASPTVAGQPDVNGEIARLRASLPK